MPSLDYFFPLILVLFAVPLFFQARRQKRAVNEQQKLQKSIVVGDRVMTTSGLFGTVVSTDEDSIDLEIADGVTTTWVRAAIREKANIEQADDAEVAEAETAEKAEPETASGETAAKVAEPIEEQKTK